MTVAVIVPCFNENSDRVEKTVRSALAVAPLVVLVDDGSTKLIATPLNSHGRLDVIRFDENRGPSAAMNAGVEAAIAIGATRIARLDVGDTFRMKPKLRQLEQSIAWPALFSSHRNAVSGEDFSPPSNWQNVIYRDGVFCICTMVVTVEVWRAVNGFDESLRYGDDWDFAMRVQNAIGWRHFDEVTCDAGVFPGGHTMTATVDPAKRARRDTDTERTRERGRMLGQPHHVPFLFDAKYRAKRGLGPL